MSVGAYVPETRSRRRPAIPSESARRLLADPAILGLAALTVLAAVLRFYRLGHQGFWFDEANTSADMRYSPGRMLGLLPQNETTPALFYMVGWVWGRVFGFSEAPLRALPALCGVLTVPVIYAAGRRLISSRAGLVAAALTACNPFLIWYSQEARPYEMLVLLAAASLLAFSYARERPGPATMGTWAVICSSAIATHYYALLVVVPEALWLLALHWHRRSTLLSVALVGVVGLGLLPLAVVQNHTGNANWIAPIPLLPRLSAIVPQFLIGFQAPAYEVLLRVAMAVVAIAFVLLSLRADPDERAAALNVGAIALGGFVLNLLMIAAGVDDLITRNVIALWLPAALMVAGGLGARRAGVFGLAGTVTLCAIGIVAAIGVAQNRQFQRPDWRGPARLLGARPAPGITRAILVQRYQWALPMSLYVEGLEPWPHHHHTPYGSFDVSEIDVISIAAPRVALCWWGAACNLASSKMQNDYAIPGFHKLWVRRAYQFSVMRLVAHHPVVLTPRMVSDALTTTTLRRDNLLYQR